MSESKISCPHCAQHILVDDAWAGQTINCPSCQQPFTVPATTAPPPPPPPSPPGLRINRPAAPPPPRQTPPRSGPALMRSSSASGGSCGLATVSFALSLGSLLIGPFGYIPGIICGHIAKKQLRANPVLSGRGLATSGLVIGYVFLTLTILVVGFIVTTAFIAGSRAVKNQRQWNIQTGPSSGGRVPSEAMPAETAKPAVPEGAVSGTLKGQPFTYTHSSLNKAMTMFTVSEGEDFFADREVKIFLFLKPNESLENRTWKFNATSTGMNPHVHLSWKVNDSPNTEIVSTGYQLELKTGAITNDVISGSLNLKVTGKTPAELKGNFNAKVE